MIPAFLPSSPRFPPAAPSGGGAPRAVLLPPRLAPLLHPPPGGLRARELLPPSPGGVARRSGPAAPRRRHPRRLRGAGHAGTCSPRAALQACSLPPRRDGGEPLPRRGRGEMGGGWREPAGRSGGARGAMRGAALVPGATPRQRPRAGPGRAPRGWRHGLLGLLGILKVAEGGAEGDTQGGIASALPHHYFTPISGCVRHHPLVESL